jgi:uncharacterized protein YjgD (DUF1641 family)
VAQPITFEPPATDARAELQSRLESAPIEHAEALLASYELLQTLHESGALDIVRSALKSREKLLEIAVGAAGSDTSVRAIRNLLLLINVLGAIDPEVLKRFTQVAPVAMNRMVHEPRHPSLWTLIRDFFRNQDFRRGMGSVNVLLESLGRSLSVDDAKTDHPAPR